LSPANQTVAKVRKTQKREVFDAMGMTMTEKILAAHAGLSEVKPGELITCKVDLCMANDVTAPLAIKEFRKIGINRVFDPEKIVLVPSHYAPNKDIQAAEQVKIMREFAREMGIKRYYEVGRGGIEHALVPEEVWLIRAWSMSGRTPTLARLARWVAFQQA